MLFTDIEGSTTLLAASGRRVGEQEYDALMLIRRQLRGAG